MKHTEGEWVAEHLYSAICVGDQTLARIYWSDGRSDEENIANAKLIEAAPRLYKALSDLLNFAETQDIWGEEITIAKELIEKLNG